MVTGGDTSCLSPSSELVTVVGRPGLYDFIAADVISAQLIVMVPQGLRRDCSRWEKWLPEQPAL